MIDSGRPRLVVEQGRYAHCGQLVTLPPNAVECDAEGCDGLAGWTVNVGRERADGFVVGNYCAEHIGAALARSITPNKSVTCTPLVWRG